MSDTKTESFGNIKILYEDNHIICAVKPRGILSQADSTGASDMLTLLGRYVADRYNKPGNVYLGLVHRLDRPVGGVMVFARTSKAAARLSEQIRERAVAKTYLAVVKGDLRVSDMPDASGVPDKTDLANVVVRLEHRISKDRHRNIVTVSDAFTDIVRDNDIGKDPYMYTAKSMDKEMAALEYSVLETVKLASARESSYTLVKVGLITGRPHQIRAQFAFIGHPVVGDRKYGRLSVSGRFSKSRELTGMLDFDSWRGEHAVEAPALWACALEFRHPVKSETVKISALPPTHEYPWNIFKTISPENY